MQLSRMELSIQPKRRGAGAASNVSLFSFSVKRERSSRVHSTKKRGWKETLLTNGQLVCVCVCVSICKISTQLLPSSVGSIGLVLIEYSTRVALKRVKEKKRKEAKAKSSLACISVGRKEHIFFRKKLHLHLLSMESFFSFYIAIVSISVTAHSNIRLILDGKWWE